MDRKLQESLLKQDAVVSYWANRKLLPEFTAAQMGGSYRRGSRDITDMISEDRDGPLPLSALLAQQIDIDIALPANDLLHFKL